MKYKGNPEYKHDSESCTGVLITNLGTPDAPTPAALRKYLKEFLSDPRVIETPKIIWWFVLHCIILRIRPRRSAEAYKKVWTENGSPLLDISIKQANKIQSAISKQSNGAIKVELAMRYGNPSIEAGLEKLRAANAEHILVFPLYPQYSAATTASTFDAVTDVLKKWRWIPEMRMINHYHDNPDYITALANSINNYWQTHTKPEKLLFSFHGLPQDYFLAGDPYHCECHKTARLVAEKLELKEDEWQLTFQSRFGPRKWLEPYTDITLKKLAHQGTKHVQIVCPGFSADCLETLEEIDMQNRAFFTEAGGETFSYIPALNDDDEHIQALSNIIMTHCQGWDKAQDDLNKRKERAIQLGAKK
ncbi:MAG: ferrochelatase 2 [marine bacterium B5-7]|nr:MAG: ferrochelatase 2 [marine bacterium B5-7]